ncbi:MAG: hypothetical protein HY706_16250 [Candidatus Hydrogenedentes bacterium]|nr:hypothetical protein [Candidatus Hydrogenedentota bacterium]
MRDRDKVIRLIYAAVDEINETLPQERQVTKSVETVLFGRSSTLESLDLVGLIVSLEEKLQEEFDTSFTLADERAMSQQRSPFRNIGTLADYISEF